MSATEIESVIDEDMLNDIPCDCDHCASGMTATTPVCYGLALGVTGMGMWACSVIHVLPTAGLVVFVEFLVVSWWRFHDSD